MALIAVDAAKRLGVAKRSITDKRFRARIGLAARKVGAKVVFLEADIDRILERGREFLPDLRNGGAR